MQKDVGCRSIAVASLIVAFIFNCSGGQSTTGTGGVFAGDVEQFCSQSASLVCGKYASCCSEVGLTTDAATCQQKGVDKCLKAAAANQNNGFVFNPQGASACVASFDKFYNGCRNVTPPLEVGDVCNTIWVGSVPVGGACTLNKQCAPVLGHIVDCPSDGATKHTCTVRQEAHEGEVCNVAGLPAGPYLGCIKGLYCKQSGDMPGVCTAPGGPGTDCSVNATFGCQVGVFCDPTTHLCTAPRDIGQACVDLIDFSCNDSSFCFHEVCNKTNVLGEHCILGAGRACTTGLLCDFETTTCIAPRAIGEACARSDQCASMGIRRQAVASS
jgi:hypothetical protein